MVARVPRALNFSHHRAITVLAASVAVVAGWPLLAALISSNQGLDLTDEGLILASADSSTYAFWGTPYGWFTRPL